MTLGVEKEKAPRDLSTQDESHHSNGQISMRGTSIAKKQES